MTRTRRSTHGPTATGRDRSGRRGRSAAAGTAAALTAAALLLTACGAGGDKDAGPQHVRTGAGPVQDDGGPSKETGTGGSKGSAPDKGDKPSQGSSPDGKAPDSSTGTSGSTDGGSSGSGSGSSSGGSGSTGSPDSGGTAQGGSSGEDAPSACRSNELRASVGADHPGAGQKNFAVVLTNTSGGTCTVYGFPGLSFLDGAGTPVTADPERTGGAKTKITLSPGKSAWAPLSFTNPEVTGGEQVTPATVRITPPDQETPLPIPWDGGPLSADGATGRAKIGPMALGTGG
ncbi:DUF4232 domain-containing protein [Streptomyces sp. NPDC007088]|uniref:DUF4232 domain-containing protein n=1 Tax=Streptomyces sp. NPDC007088 TaxID=3364773 RepID=UPI0036AA29FD